MKLSDLIGILEQQSPQDAALGWDNVGLLVGSADASVKKVFIALDATDEVIDHAIKSKADLLLTHHPMIFSGMKRIVKEDFTGRRVIRLIENHISLYAMHTNFDIYGMAQLAEAKLGLRDTSVLEPVNVDGDEDQGIGRIGYLADEIRLGDYAAQIRDIFGLGHVRVFGDEDKPVYCVAVCPGSGKSMVDLAAEAKAEVLVTGDIDHHTGIDAVMKGVAVIDAGHYGIEHIFIDYMARYLVQHAQGLKIIVEPKQEPFWVI